LDKDRQIVSQSIDMEGETALKRLFVGPKAAKGVVWFTLPGGRRLFSAGDEADTLYFLQTGRLGAFREQEDQEPQFLGVIRPGEPAGEMALIAGTSHTATTVALRDSEILALPRAAFFAEANRHPEVMAELARLMIRRARQSTHRASAAEPSVFGFVGVCAGVDVRDLVEEIAVEVRAIGFTCAVAGADAAHHDAAWFSRLEEANQIVLYAAEREDIEWAKVCGRQVDRLFLVGRSDLPPPFDPSAFSSQAIQQHRLMDLILVQPKNRNRPNGCERWLDAAPASRLFHVKASDARDAARLARVVTGTSIGLVLSGGGARAYAHIGVIKAMRETGRPIDFIGGASMGAIVGAGVAMGWDDEEIAWRVRDAFVNSNPLGDIAFPMVAMTRGRQVRNRLEHHFDTAQIADLALPFFCISSNLSSAQYRLHHRGDLVHALQASCALPGILPPVVEGDDVLVDGAVMRNFPTDIMRAWQRGPVVGVDVAVVEGLGAKDIKPPSSFLKWLITGEWRRGPPIVSILIRSATAPTARETAVAYEAADVLIVPKIEGVELRDWRAFEPAVTAGYRAAVEAFDKLDRPLGRLRKPPGDDETSADDAILSAAGR
jgi:NTE family protein